MQSERRDLYLYLSKSPFSLVPSVFFVSFFRLGSIYSPDGRNDGKTCLSSTEHTLTIARKKPAAVCSVVLSAVLRLVFSCFPGGQVAKLFQDSSLGNAVNIVVTRLILLMEDQVRCMNYC